MSEFKFCSDAKDIRSQALGKEITELFGLITAATYDLLVKIREFDQEGALATAGLMFLCPLAELAVRYRCPYRPGENTRGPCTGGSSFDQ